MRTSLWREPATVARDIWVISPNGETGAYDFNPIADLTVTEIYEFLRYLEAPDFIIKKAPSAGLFDGKTDETEMGITYRSIDEFLLTGAADKRDKSIIKRLHESSEHKRNNPIIYGGNT